MANLTNWQTLLSEISRVAKEKGVTHQQIAEETGLHRQNVGRLLSGRHCPQIDAVMSVAKVVGLTLRVENM